MTSLTIPPHLAKLDERQVREYLESIRDTADTASESYATIAGDSGSGTADQSADTFTINGGQGIQTSVTSKTMTIAGENATNTNRGIASFAEDAFDVVSGVVSFKSSGVDHDSTTNYVANEHIDWTSTTSNFSTSGTITGSSGAVDFGDATSLEIPNGAAPTVDAAGEIAVDTTITDYTGLIKYHDGTEELTVVAMPTANLSTTDTHVVQYDAVNNEFTMAAGGGGAPTDATYVTLSTDATLTNERVLTAGAGIDITDGGAGSTITIDGETASTTNAGIVELATDAEVATGTSTSLVPTVDQMGWVLISTATASTSATIEFTGLSSTYHKYVVVITDVDVDTDNTQFNMRTSTDNGSTWDSGATDYDWAYIYRRSNNTEANGGAEDDDHIEFFQFTGSGTNELWAANVEIFAHADTEYTYTLCNFTKADTAARYNVGFSGGRRVSAGDVDAIQFYMSSGNFTTGTFKLYGVKS